MKKISLLMLILVVAAALAAPAPGDHCGVGDLRG